MNIDRWQRIKSTVALAMEAPKSERAELVRTECGDDAELRREIESLIKSAEAADSIPEARAAIASAAGSMIAEQDATLRSQIERVLGHQYEIIRMLGSGGMGCVYLARERALERFVAIKVLRPDLALAETHRERFRREARIAARLTHPGILGLHSFGEIDNLWYFVMTYVRGESLSERIRREGLMPWPEAHRIFSEMADALDCAHRNDVVHRDIKPANILLDSESGHAILADFGISKMAGGAESLTATGAVLGTPDFMSPEQVTGSEVDAQSDIYSLGAVAYVMLTGREPFRSDNPTAGVYKRVIEDPVPVEALVPSVPADLASVVRKSMARDKADRWENAAALKAALAGVISTDRLPDVVRDLPSFGPYAVLWAGAWTALALMTDRSVPERALLMLVALIVPVGLMLHLWNGAGRGMRFLDLARVALWPPEWWGMWWPRALRRPSDLWDRLPLLAKAIRILLIALVPALLALVVLRVRINASVGVRHQGWVDAAEWAVFIGGSLAVAAGIFWTRRKGLALDQSLRLLIGPTLLSDGWEDPAITRMLTPVSGKIRLPDADSPSDYVRAIREVLRLAPASDADVSTRALSTAEALLKAIEKRDSELAILSRDAGPGEADRLATRLDALESSAAADTGEQSELRDLVRNQLGVVRRMQGRREVVQRDRAHLLDLMRALWTLVRATSQSTNADAGAAGRLAALCEEIRLDPANLS